MLDSLPFEGTIKVRNKGVDVAILADSATVEKAFAASRRLVVCGISTAVLEVTCLEPLDTRTLGYYEDTTGGALLAMTREIFEAVRPQVRESTHLWRFGGENERDIISEVRALRQHAISSERYKACCSCGSSSETPVSV